MTYSSAGKAVPQCTTGEPSRIPFCKPSRPAEVDSAHSRSTRFDSAASRMFPSPDNAPLFPPDGILLALLPRLRAHRTFRRGLYSRVGGFRRFRPPPFRRRFLVVRFPTVVATWRILAPMWFYAIIRGVRHPQQFPPMAVRSQFIKSSGCPGAAAFPRWLVFQRLRRAEVTTTSRQALRALSGHKGGRKHPPPSPSRLVLSLRSAN